MAPVLVNYYRYSNVKRKKERKKQNGNKHTFLSSWHFEQKVKNEMYIAMK